jgi:tRNA(His) 5'-end guanylyltransferase
VSTPEGLGEEFKAYEQEYRQVLPLKSWAVIRVDGRAFHTLTRELKRPFDDDFSQIMEKVAVRLCQEITGTVLAYTQSDEISLITTDTHKLETQPFAGGVVAKLVSLSASIASAHFMWELPYYEMCRGLHLPHRALPAFDSRVFTVPDEAAVLRYLHWRQADAQRNALNSICDAVLGKKTTRGVGAAERRQRLLAEGVDLSQYYSYAAGTAVRQERVVSDATYVDKRTGAEQVAKGVERREWWRFTAPQFRRYSLISEAQDACGTQWEPL